MQDIIDMLARQHAGAAIGLVKKPEPKPEPREYTTGVTVSTTRPVVDRSKPITRKPVTASDFEVGELEDLILTPTRKNWYFETWLEVIGLPTDLDNKHDPVFSVVLDAYLKRKKECYMTPKR